MKKIFAIVMVLAMVAAITVPLAVLASPPSSDGSTDISGTVNTMISLNAPSAITLGTSGVMALGDNTGTSSGGTVVCNNDGYSLTVADACAPIGAQSKNPMEAGYLWTGFNSSEWRLNNFLQLEVLVILGSGESGTNGITSFTSLGGHNSFNPLPVNSTSTPSNDHFSLSVKQTVANNDPVGNYSITLIFTATANP